MAHAFDAGDAILDRLGDLRFELEGAAPNCETATEITGISALGSRVTASLVKETQPSTSRMIEKTIEGSGFRIDQAEIFKAISVPDLP